jgi:hypothetical protein
MVLKNKRRLSRELQWIKVVSLSPKGVESKGGFLLYIGCRQTKKAFMVKYSFLGQHRFQTVTLRFKAAVRYLKLQEAQWKRALLKVDSSEQNSHVGIDDLPHSAIQEPFPW